MGEMKEVCGFKAKDGRIFENEKDAKKADIDYDLNKVIGELNSLDAELGRYIMEVRQKAHFNTFSTFIHHFNENTVYNNIGFVIREHWGALEEMHKIYTEKKKEYKKLYNDKNHRGFARWWYKFFNQ